MNTKLAVDGGPKACPAWPARRLFGEAEKRAAMALFDDAIASGNAFGYNGPQEEAYCREFARFMGGGYADGVNSGTTALYVALRALEIPAFSEVICPPVTDPGGVMPVALCNCVPIPADAAPGSFNVAAAQIAARITPRTRAIVVAHIAGIPVAMKPVMKLAKALGLPVIEDCAQAHGATCNGRLVGSWGTIAAFSTMFGKHHATGGQGGVVFTRDAALFDRARRCADRGKPFGLPAGSTNVVASLNFNSNDLNACIGRVQLRKLPKIVAARRRNAGWLAAACRRELQTVRILEGPPGTESSYWFLFVQLDLARLKVDKQTFAAALGAEGVPAGASYRHLFTEHEWYRQRAVFPGTTDPWGNPRYKGNPARKFALPNINRTDTCTFPLFWHERLAARDLARVLAALKKVERAYLK